ncbi:MAG TPA: GntR family transcriptional regulator [bacterium]|nr:GntR family transcriptional regulator [bacterium]
MDGVRDSIIDAVITGQLGPGDRVIEANLSRDLGVSRGPVREAFRELAEQGLLVLAPHRGATVPVLTERDAYEIYSIMMFTERLALRLVKDHLSDALLLRFKEALQAMRTAAERGDAAGVAHADLAFNDALYAFAGHRRLQRLWQGLKFQCYLLVREYADRTYASLPAIVEHHATIADLLEHARWDQLRKYLENNADRVDARLLELLKPTEPSRREA